QRFVTFSGVTADQPFVDLAGVVMRLEFSHRAIAQLLHERRSALQGPGRERRTGIRRAANVKQPPSSRAVVSHRAKAWLGGIGEFDFVSVAAKALRAFCVTLFQTDERAFFWARQFHAYTLFRRPIDSAAIVAQTRFGGG